jgi:hypothetical protein
VIIELIRIASGDNSTLGILFVDDLFECFTCEDEKRDVKVSRETRIPEGTYRIAIRNAGGMIKRYQEKFGEAAHPGMIWLQGVPGFEYVYIHIGNTEKDSDGCILVGRGATKGSDGGGTIQSSTDAYLSLYRKILYSLDSGDEVYIRIRDSIF